MALRSFLLFCLALFVVYPVQAQEEKQVNMVSMRLLAERGVVGAGDEIWVAIEQSIAPHWHTYWKNPGDSGTAPRFEWTLPEGFEMGEVQWPTPSKIDYGILANYGYEDHVILLQKLKTPDVMPQGEIILKADYEVLVCQEECVPEYGSLELSLNGMGALEEDNSAYIGHALAKLPKQDQSSKGVFGAEGDDFVLRIPLTALPQDVLLDKIKVYSEEWGLVNNVEEPSISQEGDELVISQARGDRGIEDVNQGYFVIDTGDKSVRVLANLGAVAIPAVVHEAAEVSSVYGWLQALVFAFLGGLVLNLMPCVFPVLSIKALSLVKMSAKERRHAQAHGLAYTAGVVLSFLVVAGILIGLKAAGEQIGWGFQLQDPFIVGILMVVLFLVALNLAGFFEVPSHFSNVGSKLTHGHGVSGSFFTGVLATMVAAPCTAPFMAGAIGYALSQSAVVALVIFAALGFGLALPYLLLSFMPILQKMMPKPGAWMDVFKQFLAFPMFATVVWLMWVLSIQTGSHGVLLGGFSLVLIAFALWLWKVRRALARLLSLICVVGALLCLLWLPQGGGFVEADQMSGELAVIDYSPVALDEALATSEPVFVEMTAAWCITCKVNHKTSIDIDATRAIMTRRNIQYLVGDWTNQDAEITKYLQSYGRSGVPIYVYYGRPDPQSGVRPEAALLPQILTPGIVAEILDK